MFFNYSFSYANSISSQRSEASSTFSSPIPFKRAKLSQNNSEAINRLKDEIPVQAQVDLDEIYKNSQKCAEIQSKIKEGRFRMASFKATLQVADLIFSNWENSDPKQPEFRARKQQFSNYVVGFVMRVGPSVATILHALLYTLKLRSIYPRARGEQGCAHRLFVVSLLVAARYLNDRQLLIRPSHSAWSTLSGVFTSRELYRMEVEFVTFLRGKLYVGKFQMERSVEELFFDDDGEMGMIVPGSIDWLEMISVKSKGQKDTVECDESLVPTE
jgi:hypothetical protein